MADTTQLVLAASLIGAVDVFWFHLWRLRLYRQPSSVAEESTHLAAYATFIAIAVVLLTADSAHEVRWPVLGLFAVHLTMGTLLVRTILSRRKRAQPATNPRQLAPVMPRPQAVSPH